MITQDLETELAAMLCQFSLIARKPPALPFMLRRKISVTLDRELIPCTGSANVRILYGAGPGQKGLLAFGDTTRTNNRMAETDVLASRAGILCVCSLCFFFFFSLVNAAREHWAKRPGPVERLFCFVLLWPNTIESLRKGWLVKKTQQGEELTSDITTKYPEKLQNVVVLTHEIIRGITTLL